MNIHKELEQLRRDHKLIADRIDELQQQLELEITEGQYWEGKNGIFRIMQSDYLYDKDWYAKNIVSNSSCTGFYNNSSDIKRFYDLLSDKEVEKALTKEGKRRGFDKAEKWKPLWETNVEYWEPSNKTGYTYDPEEDTLFYNHTCIYYEGEFAEIIEDEWEVRTNWEAKPYLITSDGLRSINADNFKSRKEAEAVKNALNNLDK